jgi:predicted AAA+ superfamily ATPase
LKGVRLYDLLDTSTYLALSQNPGRMAQEITPKDRVVVIDEIQRLPELLNEVHRLIEEQGIRFLLTGSSARKLRRGGVNLLGGRARTKYLHPLTYRELGNRFDFLRAMARGLLPSIYFSEDTRADLQAYTDHIFNKKLLQRNDLNVPAFSRFPSGGFVMARLSTLPTSQMMLRCRAQPYTSTSRFSKIR